LPQAVIGPCLSTGEPGAAAATNAPFSRRPSPSRSNDLVPAATNAPHSRRPSPPRSNDTRAFTPSSAAGGHRPVLEHG
jgi:hypothetical protein